MPAESLKAPQMLAGWRRWPITRWGKNNVMDPCVALFTSGTEPRIVALSLALGLTIGVFPICGTTSMVCILASVILRSGCHPPTMIFATFAATPVELLLIVPYVRLGEFLLGFDRMDISPSAILGAFQGGASTDLLWRIFAGAFAWLVSAPLVCWILYMILLPLSYTLSRKSSTQPSTLPQGASVPVRKSVKVT